MQSSSVLASLVFELAGGGGQNIRGNIPILSECPLSRRKPQRCLKQVTLNILLSYQNYFFFKQVNFSLFSLRRKTFQRHQVL